TITQPSKSPLGPFCQFVQTKPAPVSTAKTSSPPLMPLITDIGPNPAASPSRDQSPKLLLEVSCFVCQADPAGVSTAKTSRRPLAVAFRVTPSARSWLPLVPDMM